MRMLPRHGACVQTMHALYQREDNVPRRQLAALTIARSIYYTQVSYRIIMPHAFSTTDAHD